MKWMTKKEKGSTTLHKKIKQDLKENQKNLKTKGSTQSEMDLAATNNSRNHPKPDRTQQEKRMPHKWSQNTKEAEDQ